MGFGPTEGVLFFAEYGRTVHAVNCTTGERLSTFSLGSVVSIRNDVLLKVILFILPCRYIRRSRDWLPAAQCCTLEMMTAVPIYMIIPTGNGWEACLGSDDLLVAKQPQCKATCSANCEGGRK